MLVLLLAQSLASAKTVRLITIGPGDEFWSAFGHTALAIDQDVYGFGYFSFEQEGLIKAFIDNQMYYEIGLSDLNEEVQLAQWQNRSFWVQQLKLSDTQIQEIEEHLIWHILPENQSYHYDYFNNNCSTKIRDLLDQVWQGRLQRKFDQPTALNHYQLTVPANQQSWMNLGISLVYGWSAYQPRTAWELMAYPEYLYAAMETSMQQQIDHTQLVYQQQSITVWQMIWQTHGAILAILGFGLVLLAFGRTRRFMAWILVVSQSLIGVTLGAFWMIGGYEMASMNFNLLLFMPLAWLLIWWPVMKRILMFCYVLWSLIALYLGAWYLTPFLVLHVLAVWVLRQPRPRSNIFQGA
ncbi:DUF4105 domain-containing protein [Marinicella sediminis]|uniref:DUF4105 domain-containing protein n=1 Tax=Marinicella sediminis TaxID=1792834 RepID=A0ABV7JA39_9GAMM|nr:DUF4105 domain-containing protein [Marinicella sediminis]